MSFVAKYTDLVTLVRSAVAAQGNRPLFGVEGKNESAGTWQWLTYGELGKLVDHFRAGLASLGVAKGDRVAIIANNRVEWAVGACAAHSLGAVYVPMYEVQLEKDWRYILADCRAKVCIVADGSIAAKVRGVRADLPALEHIVCIAGDAEGTVSYASLLARGAATAVDHVTPSPADEALYIYTSGTTGAPKGVRLSHANIAVNVCAMHEVVAFRETDRSVSILPWAHVGGSFELFFTFLQGSAIALTDAMERIGPAILATHPTYVVGVPRIWNKFYDAITKSIADKSGFVRWMFHGAMSAAKKERRGESPTVGERFARALAKQIVFPKIREKMGGSLETAVSGAAALSKDVAEFLEALGIRVLEVYGMTEVAAIATTNRVGDSKLGTVGKALPGVRVAIDETFGGGDDGSGEIILYGHGVMLGYQGMPEETASVLMNDGGVRSGDLGRLDADGFLHITGRVREVYKLENGKFVTPVPIEEKITLSPYVTQAMVHGLNKPYNVALLVADIAALEPWCRENGIDGSDRASLVKHEKVRALLAAEIEARTNDFKGYERVKAFVVVAEDFSTANDMLTPTLKLKRRNVLKRYGAELEALYR